MPFLIAVILICNFRVLPCEAENEDEKYLRARMRMVKKDLAGRDITDPKVLEVMSRIPRHLFVPPKYRSKAYADQPLPIGEGQTISQPYIVAFMTQALRLKGSEKVLEIGTGSGYQAAVLAEIVKEVYTIEIRERLAKSATERLQKMGYKNIHVKCADGYFGWKEHAPFDAIIVTCAANHYPPPLFQQLKEGGRMVIPLGSTYFYQTLVLIKKVNGKPRVKNLMGVVFVPMIGEALKHK